MEAKFLNGSNGAAPATYDITVELEGRELTFALAIEDAMRLITSIQAEVLDHWGGGPGEGSIAVIHADNITLGVGPKGHVLRVDTPEIGPIVLDLGPTGLANLVRAYNRGMS